MLRHLNFFEYMGETFEDILHRLRQWGLGLAYIAAALFTVFAISSYSPFDPSFNTETSGRTHNLMGVTGSYFADLALQITGIAPILVAIVLMTWGFMVITDRPLKKAWLRTTSLIISLPVTAALLASLPSPKWWPMDTSLGGVIGDFIGGKLISTLTIWGYAALFTVLFIAVYGFSFGLTPRQWKKFFMKVGDTTSTIYGAAHDFFTSLLARDPDEYVDEDEEEEEDEEEDEEEEEEEEDEYEAEEEDEEEAKPAKKSKKKSKAVILDYGSESKKAEKPKEKKERKTLKGFQASLRLGKNVVGFELPPMSLLTASKKSGRASYSESSLAQNARLLESVLEDYRINGQIVKIRPGPVVTLYELEPAPGTKTSRIIALADDIARSMSSISARISTIPGKNAIGIELPNATREGVVLRDLMESKEFKDNEALLPLILGKDIGGESIVVDLAKMPHLLVAGTTGSGKSVAVNSMILSLLYRLTPEQCKFIMIDPKMLELSIYDGIPHLLAPVVTEPGKAVVALKWTVKEMENRYRLMSQLGVRNIAGYNERIEQAVARGEKITRSVQTGYDPDTGKPIIEEMPLEMSPLPLIVVVVDEMADLMVVAGKDIETSVQRLAQMARAAGIHIIMATQRPSVDVITGVIKANFPTRISFQVTSKIDSRTILGEQGAEQLLGKGDMLYMAGGGKITRVHGPFVSDPEVEAIVKFLKDQGEPQYLEDVTRDEEEGELSLDGDVGSGEDGLYRQAVNIVINDGKASTSYIQRKLKIGYNKAANLIERMEKEGIVSPANHAGKREILGR